MRSTPMGPIFSVLMLLDNKNQTPMLTNIPQSQSFSKLVKPKPENR